MFRYALRRLLLAFPLLIGITFVSFVVIHLAPGRPGEVVTGELSAESQKELWQMLEKEYGLDKPLHVQYWTWLGRLARLDFGRSFSPDARPVLHKIGQRPPLTPLLHLTPKLILLAFPF